VQELDDNALLREYTEHDSEAAFATLVTRHVNKVYSVALRHTRNPHQAEEITQAVFVILARKSRHLSKRVILSGWLYQTARLTAVTFIRGEIRRARREQEAHMQTFLNESESYFWPQIAPLLDAAMAGLSEVDRHAVVLRFFDGKSMKEVGVALGASEDAAKMRLNRTVEKLRLFFTKRGVVLPAAALTAAISANSVQAAPAMLAKTATAVAFAKGATVSGSTLTLIKGALKIMAWTKAKMAIVTSLAIIACLATTTLIVQHPQTLSSDAKLVWLTPSEITAATTPGLFTRTKNRLMNLTAPLWRRYWSNQSQIVIDSRLMSLSPGAVEETKLGAPLSTNLDGVQAWILSSTELNALLQRWRVVPGASVINNPRVLTLSGMKASCSAGSFNPDGNIQFGLTVDVTPEFARGAVRLWIGLTSTEMIASSPTNVGEAITNLAIACRALLPNGGGLVLRGTTADNSGTNYWSVVSPIVVDAAGNPKIPWPAN